MLTCVNLRRRVVNVILWHEKRHITEWGRRSHIHILQTLGSALPWPLLHYLTANLRHILFDFILTAWVSFVWSSDSDSGFRLIPFFFFFSLSLQGNLWKRENVQRRTRGASTVTAMFWRSDKSPQVREFDISLANYPLTGSDTTEVCFFFFSFFFF